MQKIGIIVEGGIGKNIAAVGAVKWIKENVKEISDIVVFASHHYVFQNTEITAYNLSEPRIFEMYSPREYFIFKPEPYHLPEWHKGRINISTAIVKMTLKILGLEERYPVSEVIPFFKVGKDEELRARNFIFSALSQNTSLSNKPILLFQPFGGYTYTNPDTNLTGRELSIELAKQLADRLSQDFFVIQVKAQNEPPVTTYFTNTTVRNSIAFLKFANLIVAVDSFLQHAARALNVKGVVLVGSTDENSISYPNFHKIVRNKKCNIAPCMRPFWGYPDLQMHEGVLGPWKCPNSYVCTDFEVDEIIEAVQSLMNSETENSQKT